MLLSVSWLLVQTMTVVRCRRGEQVMTRLAGELTDMTDEMVITRQARQLTDDMINIKMLGISVPGVPGDDYPILAEVPETSFRSRFLFLVIPF